MSRTRDMIQEIVDVRSRRLFGSSMAELPIRLFALEHAFKEHDKAQTELTRYFPVALIACIESYFRMAIKDLIDAGEPYLTRAEKLSAAMKIDFATLRAVHGKAVTVGELIAHSAQISRLEQIDGAMTSLLATDFLKSLREVSDRCACEVLGAPSSPILSEADQVYADVKMTFELRHIICHEIPSAYDIRAGEIDRCFQSCVAFLKSADELISETLHPNSALTQADMNIAAGETLAGARERLDEAVLTVRRRLDASEIPAFDRAQCKWEAYSEAWVAFSVGRREDSGTIWPLLYASAAEATVQKRLEEVTGWRRLGDPA